MATGALKSDSEFGHGWRTKGEHAILPIMARRPEPDRVLTHEELAQFTQRLSMLSPDGVERAYRDAYEECRLDRTIPQAAFVQQLVAAWKFLRKMR
jgi:hypothetical protein